MRLGGAPSIQAPAALRVHLTGRLAVDAGDASLGVESFRGRQGRIAFTYLALNHDRAVPRPELADVIWSDALPGSWEADLSAIVSRLRGAFAKLGLDGTRAITSALGCYELRLEGGAVWVDIEEARHAIEGATLALAASDPETAIGSASVAKEIARRSLLPGDASEWLDDVRSELAEIHRRSLSALADGWGAVGDFRQAIDASEEELKLDPYREPAYRRLMQLHVSGGDRAQALRVWERCRMLFSTELGVDPSPETQTVYLELLRSGTAADEPPGSRSPTAVSDHDAVTFLFTDLVGSSKLLALGEDEAEAIRRTHLRMLRDAVATRGGEEVKTLGDGLMVAFSSVRDALGCAVAVQQAVERHNRRAQRPIAVRIGLHVGEPIRDEQDYFGTPVDVARRLCDEAAGGQILASDLVRRLAGPHGVTFADAGTGTLKGVGEPITVHEVAWTAGPDDTIALPTVLHPPADPPFVGRGEALSWMQDRLRETSAGRLQIALIPGDPGMGKTRLVSEFSAEAQSRGTPVLYGRCDEEALLAYQPFVEAIERFSANASLDNLRRHAGRGASDLARVVPAVTRRLPDLPPPLSGETDSERFRLFDAVTSLLASLADDAPTILVIEDIHWADRPTLQMLRQLARDAPRSPILILATVRDIEVTKRHPLVEVMADLRRDDALRTMQLTGLDDTAVGTIVEALTGRSDRGLIQAVMRATEGNPLFVRELARHVAETADVSALSVPEGIKGLIGRRVDRLGDDTLRTLSTAAVIGRDFDLDLLAALSDMSEEATIDVLDAAVEARVVDEVTGAVDRYTFTHALIRETLYDRLRANRRRRLHLRIAEQLERLRSADLGPYLGELAYHYGSSGEDHAAEAYTYAKRAAERSASQLAYEEAAVQLERALRALDLTEGDHSDRIRCLLGLGDARARSGDHVRASAAFLDAADLARAHAAHELFADAVLGLSTSWVRTGVVDERRTTLLTEALDLLPEGELRRRAQVTGRLAHELYHDPGSIERRVELADRALELARESGDPMTVAHCLHHRTFASWGPDTTRNELDAAAAEMVRLGRACEDPDLVIQGINWHMMAAIVPNDVDAFDEHLTAYEELANEIRQPRYLWYAQTRHAMRAIYRGQLAEGERLSLAAYEMGKRLGEADAVHVHHGQMVFVWPERLYLEGLDRLRAHVRYTAEAEAGSAASSTLLYWQAAISAIDSRLGDIEEARVFLHRLVAEDLRPIPRDYHWLPVTKWLGDIAYRCDDPASASIVFDHLRPYAGLSCCAGGANDPGVVDDGLGRLALALGRLDEAVGHLDNAIREYERTEAGSFAATTKLDLVRALQQRGGPGDHGRARDLLVVARAEAERGGLRLLLTELENTSS